MDIDPILEALSPEGCCPGCKKAAMYALFMQLRPPLGIDLTATSEIKESLLQTDLVRLLIDAVGTPNQSQPFYHQAISCLCFLTDMSSIDDDRMQVDERVMPQILEHHGCETVLERLKNATTDAFVAHSCATFLYLVLDRVPVEARTEMSRDVLHAVEIVFGRNVEECFKESVWSFSLCCKLIPKAFSGIRQSPDDYSDFLLRAVRFALQGYKFFHGDEDPDAQDSAKMLVEILLGEEKAQDLINDFTDHCEPCAPAA